MDTRFVEQRNPVPPAHDWSRALTLTERRDIHRAAGGGPDAPPADVQELLRRHEYWAGQPVHETADDLERRLALDGISLAEYDALSRGVPLPPDVDAWPWLAHVEAVCRNWEDLQARGPADAGNENPVIDAMATVTVPFHRTLEQDLATDLEALRSDDPDGVLADGDLLHAMVAGFDTRARDASFPAALLELHVVRHEAGLGDTDIGRAAELLRERLRGPGGPAFLREYPVMGRTLAEFALLHRRNAVELARRVRDDATLLAETFAGGGDLGRLVEVSEPWGDAHHGGRTVRALGFSSGVKVLYKPRPLAVDVFAADFLRWLNSRGITATQRPVNAVDRGDYGWTEVIEAKPCSSREDVEHFYRRQGGLLAVCHLLAAKDLHFENVIAEGSHPVAVDLEGFFQPVLSQKQADNGFSGGAFQLIETGLLPTGMMQVAGQYAAFDASGMAGSGGVLPLTVMRVGSPEDGLRFEPAPMQLEAHSNVPVLDGQRQPPRPHTDAVEAGFREVAGAILDGRDELTGPGGLLERAVGLPVRIFLRASNVYGRLVAASFHPDVLRDALDRERLYDWLPKQAGFDALRAAFPAERVELLAGDVPMFASRSDASEITTAGHVPIGAASHLPGLDVARDRIRGLDASTVDDLVWMLRAGIASTAKQGEDPAWPVLTCAPARTGALRTDAMRRHAMELAGVLARRAERGPVGTAWVGLEPAGTEGWALAPLDTGLYNGTSGIVLFLAYAGACGGDAHLTARAREGLDAIRRTWERKLADDPRGDRLASATIGGAFSELGGTVFALGHLAALWDRDDLAGEALALAGVLEHRLGDVVESDVMAGMAGTLAVVLGLHALAGHERLLRLATRCGDLLAERAQAREGGLAWPTGDSLYLAGFAHGAAGIAASLARLGAVTGEPRWWRLAAGARAFEESLYSEEYGNWQDARPIEAGGDPSWRYPVFWCHGAPGVALARASMLDGDDGDAARDLETAVATTLGWQQYGTHCLCHGGLGNLLVLRRCSEVAPSSVPAGLPELTAAVLESAGPHGFVCGVPDGVATPGFMLGLAGIGYALLALSDPALPTLIGLEGPAGE